MRDTLPDKLHLAMDARRTESGPKSGTGLQLTVTLDLDGLLVTGVQSV